MLRPRAVLVDKPALKEASAQWDPAHYDLPLSRLSRRLQARPRRGFLHALAAVVAIAGVAFLVLRCYAGSLRIATRARHSERRLASGEGGEGPWPFGGSAELEGSCEEAAEQQPPGPAQGGRRQPLPPATAGPEDNTSGAARRPGTRPTHGKDMAKMLRLYMEEALEAAHLRDDHPSSSDESTPPGSPQPAPTSAEGQRYVNRSDSDTVSEAAGVSGERERGRGTESSSSEGEGSVGSLDDLDAEFLAFLDKLQSAVFEEGRVEAEKKALLDLLWTTADAPHASPERQAATEGLPPGMPLVTGVSPPPKTDQQAVTSIPPSSGSSRSSTSQQEAPFGKPHEESRVERPSSSKKRKRLEEHGEHGILQEEAPAAKKPHFSSATGSTLQTVLAAKEEHVSPSESGRAEEVAGAFGEEGESSGTRSSAFEDQDSSDLLNELLGEYLGETLHAAESSAAQVEGHAQAGPATDVEATQDELPAPQSAPRLSSFATALQQENRYRQHPFVRLPRSWPHGMVFPGNFVNVYFAARPKRPLAAILNSIRAILAKEILEKDDMEVLSASTFELMGHIGCSFFREMQSLRASHNIQTMAKRFLAAFYLLAACQVLGPTMRLEEWWTDRMRLPLSPPAWWTEAHRQHLQEGRNSELLWSLIKGVQILSECRLPPPEITVYIMRSLLCQEGTVQYFTHPEFNAWREMDAAFISETSQAGPATRVATTQEEYPPPQSAPMPTPFLVALQQENRYGRHPFVRLPRSWPHGMVFPVDEANKYFETRPTRFLPVLLNSIRAILVKDRLDVADMQMLSTSTFELMGYVNCFFTRPVQSRKISNNMEGLGKRFLAGFYLLSACQVLGPTMRLEQWWPEQMKLPLSPPTWWRESHSHHLQGGRGAKLLQSLVKGLQILSERQLPPADLTVHIMRSLLCHKKSLKYFMHPDFDPWREVDAAFFSETSSDSASASSGEED
ncbi:hypothetical protein Efla_004197 [Eimeria flavescens]